MRGHSSRHKKVGSTPRIGISIHKGTEVCKHLPVKKRGDLYGSDTTYLEMEQRPQHRVVLQSLADSILNFILYSEFNEQPLRISNGVS